MDHPIWRPLVIAHRALVPGVAENSLAAIRASATAGANIVELDIRGSLDNVPFLIHDPLLTRTTRFRGPVRLMPAPLLRRIKLRGSEETLPPFNDVVSQVPAGLTIGLHLKEERVLRPVLAALNGHGLTDQSWLWLETPHIVQLARQLAPGINITLINAYLTADNAAPHLDQARAIGVQAVSPDWHQVNPELLGQAHDRGIGIFSVYPDNGQVPAAIRAGIDGIITDDPGAVRSIVDEISAG